MCEIISLSAGCSLVFFLYGHEFLIGYYFSIMQCMQLHEFLFSITTDSESFTFFTQAVQTPFRSYLSDMLALVSIFFASCMPLSFHLS
jgi:hypothetical protein